MKACGLDLHFGYMIKFLHNSFNVTAKIVILYSFLELWDCRPSKLPSLDVAVPASFCCLSWVARLGLGGGTVPATDSWCMLRLLDLRRGRCGDDCAGAGLLTARWLILRLTDDCWGRDRGLRVWGRAVSATAGSSVGLLRGLAS